MKQKNKLLPYAVIATMGIGLGYMMGKSNSANQYEINSGMISYHGLYERPITIESEKIIVGSIKERISDLLLESPGRVKSVTEELLYEQNVHKGER